MTQTLASKVKQIKSIPFQKENQSAAFIKSHGTTFFFKITSQIDLLRSYMEQKVQLSLMPW